MSKEWSCCKDGVCKHCGAALADCQSRVDDKGCGAHVVLPETDVSRYVDRFGVR